MSHRPGPWKSLFSLVVFLCCLTVLSRGQETALHLTEWKSVMDEILKVQAVKTPKDLCKRNPRVTDGMFDPGKYFVCLKHLSMEPGFQLDFVYDYQELGGHPVLYPRKKEDKPFEMLAAFKKVYPRPYFLGDDVRYNPAYLERIKTDDSPDGFLQLATLIQLGEQFFIFWHAWYYVQEIVPDRETLATIAVTLPPNVASQAKGVDPQPKVIMEKDRVKVEFLVFSQWSGFTRIEWLVKRQFPHTLIKCSKKVLVPWKCPLQF